MVARVLNFIIFVVVPILHASRLNTARTSIQAKLRHDEDFASPGQPPADDPMKGLAPPVQVARRPPLQPGVCGTGDWKYKPEEYFRLFLSVVADKFAADGDDGYDGDFFIDGRRDPMARCHYLRVLERAALKAVAYQSEFPDLQEKLEHLHDIIDRSHWILLKTGDVKRDAIEMTSSMWKRINELDYKEEVFFPLGWTGHRIYGEVIRDGEDPPTYSLGIYNSGGGINWHYSIMHDGLAKKFSPVLYFSRIPKHEMLHPSQLRAILEPEVIAFASDVKSDQNTFYDLALGRLEQYLDVPRSTAVMLDDQTGGTCMVHSLRHYLHYKIRYGRTPDEQEKIGKAAYHTMQSAAMDLFVTDVVERGTELREILPKLELAHTFPTPENNERSEYSVRPVLKDIASNNFKRAQHIILLAARQVAQYNPHDGDTKAQVRKIQFWIDSQILPEPEGGLHDKGEAPLTRRPEFDMNRESYYHVSDNSTPPERRVCTLPNLVLPSRDGRQLDAGLIDVPAALEELGTEFKINDVEACFGENFVDWLAQRLLAMDLSKLSVEKRRLIVPVYKLLVEHMRRFGATQPFVDHLMALQKLLVKYHDLSVVANERWLNEEGLEGAPSYKQISVTYTMEKIPLETPENGLLSSIVRGVDLSNRTEPKKPYTYIPWTKKWDSMPKAYQQFSCVCNTHVSLPGNEIAQGEACRARDEDGKVVTGGYDVNTDALSPEQYAVDFIKFVRAKKAINGVKMTFQDTGFRSCIEDVRVAGVRMEDGLAALCLLTFKSGIVLQRGGMDTATYGLGVDFQNLRQMLIEFHVLESAIASRRDPIGSLPHGSVSYTPRETVESMGGNVVTKHYARLTLCNIGGNMESRKKQLTHGVRHPTRASLHAVLGDRDQQAMSQFLFRDARPDKWDDSSYFLLRHDGDNAIVFYDLEYFEDKNKKLSMFQRTLFEIGLHSVQTREHWLGYLQEHPYCFLKARCIVANDAVLLSEKYNPSTCTSRPDTPDSYFQQVLRVMETHEVALSGGEPSFDRIIGASYARVTRYRVRAQQHMDLDTRVPEAELKEARETIVHLRKAGSGDFEPEEQLRELRYTLACMELMVFIDVSKTHKLGSLLEKELTTECAAFFHYMTSLFLEEIDPSMYHQAVRAHGKVVTKPMPHMCKMIEDEDSFDINAGFPYLKCGQTRMNMLSGQKIDVGVVNLNLYDLPVALRENPFTSRALSLGVKSFRQISEETYKLVTSDDVSYYFSQDLDWNGNVRDTYIHRKHPDSYDPPLQLLARCSFKQKNAETQYYSAGTTFETDIRTSLLGTGSADAFCWRNRMPGESALLEITRIDENGVDENLALLEIQDKYTDVHAEFYITAYKGSDIIPAGPQVKLDLGKLWLKTLRYGGKTVATPSGRAAKIYTQEPEKLIQAAGLLSRFHETRGTLGLDEDRYDKQSNYIVFHGISARPRVPVIIQRPASGHPYILKDGQDEWEVVDVGGYETGLEYLYHHGIPHLVLSKGGKFAVALAGPSGSAGSNDHCERCEQDQRLKDKPHDDEKEKGCWELCWWGLPVRDLVIAEAVVDEDGKPTGMLQPKLREHRLQLLLLMTRFKKFDYAFKYLDGLDHLSSWTSNEIFLLHELASTPISLRDPETAYLRLLGTKLLYDECMRFAAPRCEERVRVDKKAGKVAMDLVLQTMHLMPVYRIVDMRNQKLTRYLSDKDLAPVADGLRGWLYGSKKPMPVLLPKRGKIHKAVTESASTCCATKLLRKNSQSWWSSYSDRWYEKFPETLISSGFSYLKNDYKGLQQFNGELNTNKVISLFRENTGFFMQGDTLEATDLSNLVSLYLWSQPINPLLSDDDTSGEAGRIALLLQIYRLRSQLNIWQMNLFGPLVEMWLPQTNKRENVKIMAGFMQLLMTVEQSKAITPFKIMIYNLDHWSEFEPPLAREWNRPKSCCLVESSNYTSASAMEGAVNDLWRPAHFDPGDAPIYNWKPQDRPVLFEQGATVVSDTDARKCKKPTKSSDTLKADLLNRAKAAMIESAHAYVLLPETDEELLQVLSLLYSEGGLFQVAFPTEDPVDLYCLVQQLMLAKTKEYREAAEAKGDPRPQTLYLDKWPVEQGRRLLVFEYQTTFTIRKEQIDQLKHLLADTDQPRIMQIMMGGGKTAVLSPVIIQGVQGLGMFMSPSGVFNQNAKDLSEKSLLVYGQRGRTLGCYRSLLQQEPTTLEWTLRQLEEAKRNHNYVLMLPKTFQCFQNLLVMNMGNKHNYQFILDILGYMKDHTTAVIDEIDSVFDPNLEVNFPITQAEVGQDMAAMHFLSLIFFVKAYPRENTKLTVPEYDVIKGNIAKQLVQLVVDDRLPFSLFTQNPVRIQRIAQDLVKCTAEFIAGNGGKGKHKDTLGLDCAENRDMRIINMFLRDTFFSIVRMRKNVDYGRSRLHDTQPFVIPYSSANKPVEGSKFSNYLLAVGLSLQYWFLDGSNAALFVQTIHELRKSKARVTNLKGIQVDILKEFYKQTASVYPQLKDLTTEQLMAEAELENLPEDLFTDKVVLIGAIGYVVLPSITVSGKQVTNYALNIDNHLQRFIGFSGTMSSNDIFPKRATVKDDPTVASSLKARTVTHPLNGPKNKMFQLDLDKKGLVKTMLTQGEFMNTNALLDCGAFLRNEQNAGVARAVLRYRPDIHAVFYYHDLENEIVCLRRISPTEGVVEKISKTQKLIALHSHITEKQVFLYCDQQHTVGTDLKLDFQARALLTFASTTNLDELMQAIMRMRNYQGLQSKKMDKVQDVLYAFDEKIPDSLEDLWKRAVDNTENVKGAASRSVLRRYSNLVYRRLYYEKDPDPATKEARKFSLNVFEREQDFLEVETKDNIKEKFDKIKANLPFVLTAEEEDEVDKAVAATIEVLKQGIESGPDVEEELEMEMEQEMEVEVQRLRANEDLGENAFTNNPLKFGPVYAFCDEAGIVAAKLRPQISTYGGKMDIYPCVPISSWTAGHKVPLPSPVTASLSLTILRPSTGDYNSGYTTEDRMQLFGDPWTAPASDRFQRGLRDSAKLLIDDTRKNVHNVLFMASRDDPTKFTFVFITSDEALELAEFCTSEAKRHREIALISGTKQGLYEFFTRETNEMLEVAKCEDPNRKEDYRRSIGFRFDVEQQVNVYREAYRKASEIDAVKNYLTKFWESHTCSVVDPLALPAGNYLNALIPDSDIRKRYAESSDGKDSLTKALVDVLALAGSEELITREDFKDEFEKRMGEEKFSEIYKKIREFLDEPLDPKDLSNLAGPGQACRARCAPKGYKIKKQIVKGRNTIVCTCLDKPQDESYPYPDSDSAKGAGGAMGGLPVPVFLILACCGFVACAGGVYFCFIRSSTPPPPVAQQGISFQGRHMAPIPSGQMAPVMAVQPVQSIPSAPPRTVLPGSASSTGSGGSQPDWSTRLDRHSNDAS